MTPNNTNDIQELIKQNNELLRDNNKILKKLQRFEVVGFWVRFVWYAVLIGFPFALYFYVLEPYFTALGSSYETFYQGLQEIPGLKQFNTVIDEYNKSSQR